MKKYAGINYKQRPESYWDDEDVLSSLLRNVKGRERREMIRCYWEQGRLGELQDVFLKDTLDEEERERLGQIHPLFMGGEYLPDYRMGEVEIARIELKSTTGDVISVRARKRGGRIAYRIVDEYETGFRQGRQASVRPLSLGELVRFLDRSRHPGGPKEQGGLCLCYNQACEDSVGRQGLRYFTRVRSEFYPALSSHYENVFDDWVAAEEPQPVGDEDE